LRQVKILRDLNKSWLDFFLQTSGLWFPDLPIPISREMAFDAAAMVDMAVWGEATSPSVNGNIRLTDGYLALSKNGLTYETMTANISFSGGKVEVEEFLLKGDKEGYW
jgi:autotransporter translocation and assembly factor TamB